MKLENALACQKVEKVLLLKQVFLIDEIQFLNCLLVRQQNIPLVSHQHNPILALHLGVYLKDLIEKTLDLINDLFAVLVAEIGNALQPTSGSRGEVALVENLLINGRDKFLALKKPS